MEARRKKQKPRGFDWLITAHAGDAAPVVLIDVLDDAILLAAGNLAWEGKGSGVFTASSRTGAYAWAWDAQNSLSSSSISSGSCRAASIHSWISGNAMIVWQ